MTGDASKGAVSQVEVLLSTTLLVLVMAIVAVLGRFIVHATKEGEGHRIGETESRGARSPGYAFVR
jgi:hypothetical protein